MKAEPCPATQPTKTPWHEAARRYNWNSSGAFPVSLDNQPFGMLSVYHNARGFFDAETRHLFEELAINISFALTTFRLERQRQAVMEALQSSEQRDQLRSRTLESVARGLPLPEEERHLTDLIYQSSSEAMVVTDAQNRIITVNPAFTQMTGYTLEEAYGKSPGILKSGKHDDAFFTAMWQQGPWPRPKVC